MEANTTYHVLKHYEGYVVECRENSFIAHLIDSEAKESVLETEILLSEVSKVDLPLVKMGARFYWNMGYREKEKVRENVFDLDFINQPRITQEDIETAKEQARSLCRKFGEGEIKNDRE